MSGRRAGRKLAFQLLFQVDVGRQDLDQVLANADTAAQAKPEALEFALKLTNGVLAHSKEVNDHLRRLCRSWSFDRLAFTDRTLLRLGTYEMLYEPATPLVVTISEILALAEEYSEEKAANFVNGVLGALKDEIISGKLYVEGKSNNVSDSD